MEIHNEILPRREVLWKYNFLMDYGYVYQVWNQSQTEMAYEYFMF